MAYQNYKPFGISEAVYQLSEQALNEAKQQFEHINQVKEANQLRVIEAMHQADFCEAGFGGSSGYGYHDMGRDMLDKAYAYAFGAEDALVRMQLSSGTTVLAYCLFALLRPGDLVLSVTGKPYDTIQATFGIDQKAGEDMGSLKDYQIDYQEIALTSEGYPDYPKIKQLLPQLKPKLIYIQKSRGYTHRRSLLNEDIAEIVKLVKAEHADTLVMVDNCYGEFVETTEPTMVGADLAAGSLIKNPGAGIAPSGGYICGRKDLIEKVAMRVTAPGVGREIGPSLGQTRALATGFYLAPHIVAESLKGAVHTAALFRLAGYETIPSGSEVRGDIVQILECKTEKQLIAFCKQIQSAAPIDSKFSPEPGPMPGYTHKIIMASGSFIQGSSIELSADGPLKAPYYAFLQGGLTFENCRLASLLALEKMGGGC